MKSRSLIISGLAIAGLIYAFNAMSKTPVDPTAISIIMTICSAGLSWVIADYFADKQNNSRIDGVGERSSEKILNQSKQLWEIEESLRRQADEVEDYYAAQALVSAREKIQLIRSSNNTYIGDWEGIVSDEVRDKMEKRNEAQNKLFKAESAGSAEAESSDDSLPTHLAPNSPTHDNKLITVLEQNVRSNTEQLSKGQFRVRLNRETFKFNFTGKLYPPLECIPEDLRARVVDRPEGAPSFMPVHAATGTTRDFHVHTKSNEYGVLLPVGEYVFDYIVRTEDPNAHEFDEDETGAEPLR